MDQKGTNSFLSNLKVLYVEDEEFTRLELSRFLKRRVGKLYTAADGEEALASFNENVPDLVITDLVMPNMDGIRMVKAIRQLGKDTPVIIISALSDSDTILRAVDLGIMKYVIKPIDTNSLLLAMEDMAKNILKNKMNKTIVNNSYVLGREEKIEIERRIAREIAYFIKNYTGKGPLHVQVFIQGNEITVKALGVLNVFEVSLIANNRNHSLINYNRSLLYKEHSKVLEEAIGKIVGDCNIIEAEADSQNNMDRITFSIL